MVIVCLQMWKDAEVKKTITLTHDETIKQVIELMVVNEVIESDELNKQAEEAQDPKEAAKVVQKYENIIRTKKKGIINIAFHQEKVFKRFKVKDKFITLVNQFNIHKTAMIFKINIFKLCEKHPKLLKSSVGLGFLNNYYNLGHNILRLFDVLPNFPFTASETNHDY